jgi:hypothetical protein
MGQNKISYEASKWYVKLWRHRWYLYAILLHIKIYLKITLIIDYIAKDIENSDKDEIRKNWKTLKKHVELSKMYKF